MAAKKFTEKVGYDNLLDYDPANGIVKYGSYEFFLKDLVKPTSYKLDFNEYKEQRLAPKQNAIGMGMAHFNRLTIPENVLRADFEKMVKDQTFSYGAPQKRDSFMGMGLAQIAGGNSRQESVVSYGLLEKPRPQGMAGLARAAIAGLNGTKKPKLFRQLTKLGSDTYEVTDFAIPDDVGFVDKIAERSTSIYRGASQDRDILKQNQQDSKNRRQGAASTTLG